MIKNEHGFITKKRYCLVTKRIIYEQVRAHAPKKQEKEEEEEELVLVSKPQKKPPESKPVQRARNVEDADDDDELLSNNLIPIANQNCVPSRPFTWNCRNKSCGARVYAYGAINAEKCDLCGVSRYAYADEPVETVANNVNMGEQQKQEKEDKQTQQTTEEQEKLLESLCENINRLLEHQKLLIQTMESIEYTNLILKKQKQVVMAPSSIEQISVILSGKCFKKAQKEQTSRRNRFANDFISLLSSFVRLVVK